jgi:transmembrane sensor
MSEPVTERAKDRAGEIDARAAAWLDRRDRSSWTDHDEAALEAWLNEAPVHRIAYWRMQAAWDRTQRLAALRQPKIERWKQPLFFRLAAALVLAAALGGSVWTYFSQPVGAIYATSIGGHETVMLADGSRIELNTDSAVRVLDSDGDRKVWLQKGEAYFHVAHNAARPFVVFAGDRRVTDIGTEFDVHQESDRLEVSVVEGRVSLGAADTHRDARTLVLSQGDAVVTAAEQMAMTHKSALELSNEVSWRRGVLVFDNTPLSEAAQKLNRYNQVRIVVAGTSARRLPITGTLSATDPVQFLRMVQTVFGLHEHRMNGEIVISQ